MKRTFLQHLLASTAAILTYAAVLIITPSPGFPDPGNTGNESKVEVPESEKEEDQHRQPGAEVQNGKDKDRGKSGKKINPHLCSMSLHSCSFLS